MTRLQSADSRGCAQRCFQLPLVLMMAPPAVRATGVNDDYASFGFKQKRQDSYPVSFCARKRAVTLCTTFLHRSKHANVLNLTAPRSLFSLLFLLIAQNAIRAQPKPPAITHARLSSVVLLGITPASRARWSQSEAEA